MSTAFSFRYVRKRRFWRRVWYVLLQYFAYNLNFDTFGHRLLNWGHTFHCNVALKIIKFWNSIWQVILGQLSDSLRGYLWIKITQNYAEILDLSNEWFIFLQILSSSQSVWTSPSRTSRMAPIQQECLRRIHTLRRQQRPPSKPTIVCRRPFWRIPRPEIIHR